jgi:Leucine-rich repeat (LRR) protein
MLIQNMFHFKQYDRNEGRIMKRIVSLLLVFTMIVSVVCVFAKENEYLDEPDGFGDNDRRIENLIDRYVNRFLGDTVKAQEFLDIIEQSRIGNETIDDSFLMDTYRYVRYNDIQPSIPVAVGSKANKNMTVGLFSRSVSSVVSGPVSDVRIQTPLFLSGLSGNNEITTMQVGFVRSRFDVVNDKPSDIAVMAIVKLIDPSSNAMIDVAIIEKSIAGYSSETITAGFNVPDADYEIIIELWDDGMEKYDGYTFPNNNPDPGDEEPGITATLYDYAKVFQCLVVADSITVEYNGNVEEYDDTSMGHIYIYLYEADGFMTPVVVKGEGMTHFEMSVGDIESFKSVGLSDLESLYLDHCSIADVSVKNAPNLHVLALSDSQVYNFNQTGLPNLSSLYLESNSLETFNGTGLTNLEELTLYGNSELVNVTIPKAKNNPTGYSGFRYLDLSDTPLGSMAALNSVWNGIVSNMPTLDSKYSQGQLYVSNSTLKALLQTALANKNWKVY